MHPYIYLIGAYANAIAVWIDDHDLFVTPEQYEVRCGQQTLAWAESSVHAQAGDAVGIPGRRFDPFCNDSVHALDYYCVRCDGFLSPLAPVGRVTSRFTHVTPGWAGQTVFFAGVHYKMVYGYRTKVFNCVPCEAHGQVMKKWWYRSRQRCTWTRGGVRYRGYVTILQTDNMYIAFVAHGLVTQ